MSNRRRQAKESHPNHERWVISYADFMTLLLAFFIVMFATANADKAKAKLFSEAVKAAFSQGSDSALQAAAKASVLNSSQKYDARAFVAALAELSTYQNLLKQSLKGEIQRGEVDVHMEKRGLIISFRQAALFDSGQAIVKPSGLPTMSKVATVILKLPNQIRLEGHTDNIPIHNDVFKNNWELSSARSIAILNLLVDKFGLQTNRLSVSGYADVAPVAANTTEEGRSRNRRVDLVVLSSIAGWSEPGRSETVASR
jgi:chemotaxis protein MotB